MPTPSDHPDWSYCKDHIHYQISASGGSWSRWMQDSFPDLPPIRDYFKEDVDDAFDWLSRYHRNVSEGYAYILSDRSTDRHYYWFHVNNYRQMTMAIIRAMLDNIAGYGLHYSLATIPHSKTQYQGITFEDRPTHWWLWAEIDDMTKANRGLKGLPYTQYWIQGRSDGSGFYLYWELTEGHTSDQAGSLWQRTNQGIGDWIGDAQGANLRHMRLPGSHHNKTGRGNHRFFLNPPALTGRFSSLMKDRYALKDFDQVLRPEPKEGLSLTGETIQLVGDDLRNYVLKLINDCADTVSKMGKGNRNRPLYEAAFLVGSYIGEDYSLYERAYDLLSKAAIKAGHDSGNSKATAKSGLKSGMRAPRDGVVSSAEYQQAL